MNFLIKNRFFFWVLLVLVVINVAALLTLLFYFPGRTESGTPPSAETGTVAGIQQELSLTPEQSEAAHLINLEYSNGSRPIVDEIRNKRLDLLDEISSGNPDTTSINKIIFELSGLQASLHRKNTDQYLALKNICNPEQAVKLSELYRKLYGCDHPGFQNRKGAGHGQGRGIRHRYGQGYNDSNKKSEAGNRY